MPTLQHTTKTSFSDDGDVFPLKFEVTRGDDSGSEYSEEDEVFSIYEKPLPPPPIHPDAPAPTVLGRRGMGLIRHQRSPSPLSVEWDPEGDLERQSLSRQKAIK